MPKILGNRARDRETESHLPNFRGADALFLISYYSQEEVERKTFQIANIGHLQLQGRQNTTTEVNFVYVYFEEICQHHPQNFALKIRTW